MRHAIKPEAPPTLSDRLRDTTNLLDSSQVVSLLGIGASTLRVWTAKAEIPHLRIGRKVRFDPARLAAWLDERTVG